MSSFAALAATTNYLTLLTQIGDRDLDLARALDPATSAPTAVPTGAVRFNSANKRWEKYNGSAWGELVAAASDAFNMTVTGLRGGNIYGTVANGGTISGGTVDATVLRRGGSDVWTAASLTNLSQLTNGPGFISAAALAPYAPLAAPALTGIPTAPTAAVDTSTTQLATTAFVVNQSYLKAATAASTYAALAGAAFTGAVGLAHNVPLTIKDAGGTARRISLMSGTNTYFGDIDGTQADGSLLLLAKARLNFITDGVERVRIDAAGVGVGGNAVAQFTARGGSDEGFRVMRDGGFISGWNTAGTARSGYLQWIAGGAMTLAAEGSNWIDFFVGGVERAKIQSNGMNISHRLGVGAGGYTSDAILNITQGRTTSYGKLLRIGTSPAYGAGTDGPQIHFINEGVKEWGFGLGFGNSPDLVWYEDGNAGQTGTERMRLGGGNTGLRITDTGISVANGASHDPYGTIGVTSPADANAYSYFGLTRAGQIGWGIGIDNTNRLVLGMPSAGMAGVMGGGSLATLDQAGTLRAVNFLTSDGQQVLHAGNVSTYAPAPTGTGASGTWPIAISGNAAGVTRSVLMSGLATGGGPLTANVTVNVPKASQAQAEDGTDDTVAMTPLGVEQHTLFNDLGWGQSWQAVSRLSGTTYQNTTGRPIQLAVTFLGRLGRVYAGTSAGSLVQVTGNTSSVSEDTNSRAAHTLVIPSGHHYRIDGNINNCAELR